MPHIDRLVGVNAGDQIGLEGMRRERKQAGLFFGEDLADGSGILLRPAAPVRNAVAPFQRLPIEILERGKATGGEEGIANIADDALDASFFIPSSGLTGEGCEMIVAAKVQKPGMKSD